MACNGFSHKLFDKVDHGAAPKMKKIGMESHVLFAEKFVCETEIPLTILKGKYKVH